MSYVPKAKKERLVSHEGDVFVVTDEEGVEKELIGPTDKITEPFDPALIRVETKLFTVDLLLTRITNGELNLAPDFQRHDGIWSEGAQSRLVESMLIRIPLPAFYMDATDEEQWLVIDGLQRLSTLKRFVLTKELKLTGLEFLSQFEGKKYDELPRSFQRRILETSVTIYLIQRGTPPDVKFNIFKRINTGGLPLSAQEIRHALNQGNVTSFLEVLAQSREFKRATDNGIGEKRMGDRECVLRFLAFTITSPENYKAKDFDSFLNDSMTRINKLPHKRIRDLKMQFKRAMDAAHAIFGIYAFRKRYSLSPVGRYPINKALFETWAVNLNKLNQRQLARLRKRKKALEQGFCRLMSDRDFDTAVSQGTGDVRKVQIRFSEVEKLISKVLL